MGWIKTRDEMPKIGQPVWAYLDGYGSIFLMVREIIKEDSEEYEVWCVSYDLPFVMNNKWMANAVYDDHYIVTEWHPLPELIPIPDWESLRDSGLDKPFKYYKK